MEQIAEIQAPASQDQVKVLTELVQQLLRKNDRNQEPEDPHFITRIPVTDLTAYPELTEAFPSIGEDFFRSPLTEEERKIAIHSCPRTSSMNYNPPPLNDSASTAVKKADTALYGIQVALAQATRPIDYFVHRRIQDNPGLDTSEDPEVMFASTMRALLSDVAATVTQARLDNLHKGLELPGKPTQLVEPDTKPLMDQEALDSLIAKKPAAKRQQSSNNKNSISSNTATAQSTNAETTAEANPSNRTADRQSSFRGRGRGRGRGSHREGIQNPLQEPPLSRSGIEVVRYENSAEGSRLLQPAVHDPEKDWRPQTSLRPPQAQPTCGGAELQDGDPVFHLPHGPQKRLFDIPRPTGCIHAYPGIQAVSEVPTLSLEWPLFPVSGPTIRAITEPVGHDAEGSENQDTGSSTRGLQNSECWPDEIENSSELYWESSSNVNRSPTWPPNDSKTPGAQDLLPVDIEIMDFDSETDEP
ncbi:hypothetical protein AYI70_g5683, partial [Smittium culicis]